MDSTYQTLLKRRIKRYQNRIDGLKKEKAIYKYVLDHVGEKVIKTKLMRRFQYAVYGTDTHNFNNTRLLKYIRAEVTRIYTPKGKKFPVRLYRRIIRDLIWLPSDLVDQHRITTIATRYPRWGHNLCYRKTVPFWLLKEYGGPYTGREFITEINKRIRHAKTKLKQTKEDLNGRVH